MIGVFLVWLFHSSALIGISLGYTDWFIEKTPMNLLLMFLLLLWIYPIRKTGEIVLVAILFSLGMLAEWLGVQYGWFFGNYEYGENLGIKLDGVPYMIGVNWAVLTLITAALVTPYLNNNWLRIFAGAVLMLFLDFLMEGTAPRFDFWEFEGSIAPISNYLGWFGIAVLMHIVFSRFELKGNFRFSLHLYLAQCLFFIYLYAWFNL